MCDFWDLYFHCINNEIYAEFGLLYQECDTRLILSVNICL